MRFCLCETSFSDLTKHLLTRFEPSFLVRVSGNAFPRILTNLPVPRTVKCFPTRQQRWTSVWSPLTWNNRLIVSSWRTEKFTEQRCFDAAPSAIEFSCQVFPSATNHDFTIEDHRSKIRQVEFYRFPSSQVIIERLWFYKFACEKRRLHRHRAWYFAASIFTRL